MATALATRTSPTAGTPAAIVDAYARAHTRAAGATWVDVNGAEHTGLVAYKTATVGVYETPSTSEAGKLHQVAVTGRRWYDISCSCKAGHQIACVHRAVVVHGQKYGVWAIRPTQALAAVAPSTDAEIAATEAIKAEIRAELVAAPDTFLARLRATPTPAERNARALAHHGLSLAGGTRIERAGDPLEAAF